LKQFNIKAFLITIFVGLVITSVFMLFVRTEFATALFPVTALWAAFIVTGFFVGYFSNGVTFLEPGFGSIILAAILFFMLPYFEIDGFYGIWDSDWLLIYMNAVIFTFAGAWLGEKFENTSLKSDQLLATSFDWSWMIAGTLMGIISSIIIVLLLDLLLGPDPESFLIPFVLALFITGIIIGWKSPGYTVIEAGVAGFLTLTILLNVYRMTLQTEEPIGSIAIIVGLMVGFLETYFGGAVGEKIQEYYDKKRNKKHKRKEKIAKQ